MIYTTSLLRFTSAAILMLLAASIALATLIPTVAAQSPTNFRVTITNTTSPEMVVTPGAYLIHTASGAFWSAGSTANLALERIAEVGNSGEAVAALGAVAIDAAPARGDTVVFDFSASPGDRFSFAQMLVASNDGFVGVDSLLLFEGGHPQSLTVDLAAWDAGTEANEALFSGFDGGQPDPSQGAANVDNGAATSDPVAAHGQFTGSQATLQIAPLTVAALPATGSGGLGDSSGSSPWQLAVIAAVASVLVLGGLRLFSARR